jgi:hypothetical protein
VAGAASDTRKTSSAARDAPGTCVLPAGAATDARKTSLPARTAAGTIELAAGAAVAVGIAAAPARILLEDDMSGSRACRRACCERFSRRHWHNSNRRGNSSAEHQGFDYVQFR